MTTSMHARLNKAAPSGGMEMTVIVSLLQLDARAGSTGPDAVSIYLTLPLLDRDLKSMRSAGGTTNVHYINRTAPPNIDDGVHQDDHIQRGEN